MVRFIFMLTRRDTTIPDAGEVFEEIKDAGVEYIGFKDVGLPPEELRRLVEKMKKAQMATFLEVVSESKEACLRSAKMALQLQVDYLIGGIAVDETLELIHGSGIQYFPYVGKIVGHPSLLRGTIDEIVEDAKGTERKGVDGINLLAYRYDGDVEALISRVKSVVHIPLIVAGSIDSKERILKMKAYGVWGFTIGGAILEKRFVPQGSVKDQITYVLSLV